MRRWRPGALLFMLLMLDAALACAAPVELTEQERLWIAQHPVLRVGVMENLVPFEYMSNGVLQGRPVQYLQYVRDATGLEFTYVPVKTRAARERMLLDGQVDLLSSHFRFRDEPPIEDLTALVYDTTVPIIVTRVDDADIFDLDQLQDKTVVIPDVEYYEQLLRKRAPRATLIKSPQALAMLNTLRDGGADAVVASEAFLMPYLYRQFQGVLEISGVVGSSMLDVNMAVRTDNAMLASIIGKALGSISPSQQNAMYEHWYRDLEVDAPTLWDIASHYLHLLILGMLALIGLCVLVYRGYRQQRQAERNEQEKTMFLAVMGHEIRSPMNAVLAAMELLWHTRLNDQQRHFAHLANSGANMLVRLLDDVLHRPDSGAKALRLTLEATDVIALVHGVVGLHRLRAGEKHLSLNVSVQTPLPSLWLDRSRLTQVFHNLLSNAIKFTDTGAVDITLRLEDLLDGKHQLQVEVRDTGIGMGEAVQASLFRPYAQASQSYKRAGGSGLGLMICRQLVDLMQGSLTLRSEPGVGTCINLYLPATLAPEAAEPTRAPAPMPLHVTDGLQLLVVEDTLANQEVLQAQISGFGCVPVIAADAAQARVRFAERTYALVLMDCDLPDQDGYSLVCELRALEQQWGRARCPIIAISALTGEQHLQRCLAAGMDGALSKPIRLGQLSDVIEQWCGVTLAAPRASLMAPTLHQAAINREMAADLGSLLRAMALCDRPSAIHVAHRLHGAALIIEWPALAQAAAHMENLLRAEEGWGNPVYVHTLQALVQHWRAVSEETPLDMLAMVAPPPMTQQ